MKVLFVITRTDTVGGAQGHVRDLARQLQQSGHQVQVITGPQGIFSEALEAAGITTVACPALGNTLNPLTDLQALSQLHSVIQQFTPDLVSLHSSKAGLLGRLLCRYLKLPCTFTAHGWAFTPGVPQPQRTLYRWLETWTASLADRIICVSDYDRHLGLQAQINAATLVTIHNGIPDHPARACPAAGDPVRIIMVARFDRQKDHLTVLQAIAELPTAHLDLVGDGPDLPLIQQYIEQYHLSDRTRFWGFRSDVAELLAQAQIFTLMSHWEGFPLATLEAMRAGLPVVVGQVGGTAEAVVEGVTGYCVPPQDAVTLRDRLRHLIQHPELRQQMGQAGRQHYEAAFTFEQMYQQTLAVYQQVVAQQPYLHVT